MDQFFLFAQYALITAAAAVLTVAAYIDLKSFLIPNWSSGSLFVLGLVFVGLHNWYDLVPALGVSLTLFLIGALLFKTGVVGGGDVKLLSALGVWAGLHWLFALLFIMACAGGVQSLLLFGSRWVRSLKIFGGAGVDLDQLFSAKVPYGLSIAVAGLYIFVRIIVQINTGS